jgi:hypothetical protein
LVYKAEGSYAEGSYAEGKSRLYFTQLKIAINLPIFYPTFIQ